MYKIDAHNHPDFQGGICKKVLENMDELGIDKLCLMPCLNPFFFKGEDKIATVGSIDPISFDRCLKYYEQAPDRFILGYCPDPRRPDAIVKMKSAIDLYGVQVCGEVKFRMMYDNPDAVDLFRFCGENGIPVILHFDNAEAHRNNPAANRKYNWHGGDIYTLDRLLTLCPETNFLGHAPGFWGCISNDDLWKTVAYPTGPVVRGGLVEQLLEKHSNLYCDCSAGSACTALGRDPEYTKELMLRYPDRFIFGRDEYSNVLVEFIDTLNLPAEVLEGFYHKNFEALLPEKK